MATDSAVLIFTAPDPASLALARSLLDSEGIRFATKGEQTGGTVGGWGWTPAFGAPELWVRPEDAHRALALLRDIATRDAQAACTYCGSREIVEGRRGLAAMLLAVGFAVGSGFEVEGMRPLGLIIFVVAAVFATIAYRIVGRDRCGACGRVRG